MSNKRVVPPNYQGPPAFPVEQPRPGYGPSGVSPSQASPQSVSPPYGRPAGQPVHPPVSSPYGRPGQASQPVQSPYGQSSQGTPYGQPGQATPAAYGQSSQAGPAVYGQPGQTAPTPYGQSGQAGPAAYGQSSQAVPAPYGQASGYGQPVPHGQQAYGQPASTVPADWFSAQSMALGAAAFSVAASDPSKMGQFVSTAFGLESNTGGNTNSGGWFMSKLSTFKEYFNVTHAYVRWKLLFVLLPFISDASAFNRSTSRSAAVPSNDGEAEDSLRLFPGRRPDLYIPLMGYISYILVFGLSRGGSFHPDDLYNIASLAGVLGILEVLLVKGVSYILAVPTLPLTDIVAVCGYKFANLCLSVLGLILFPTGRPLWIALWLWASLTAGLVVRKGLLSAASYNAQSTHYMGTASPEKLVAVAAAVAQLLWCWLLMPAFVPIVMQARSEFRIPEATIPDSTR